MNRYLSFTGQSRKPSIRTGGPRQPNLYKELERKSPGKKMQQTNN